MSDAGPARRARAKASDALEVAGTAARRAWANDAVKIVALVGVIFSIYLLGNGLVLNYRARGQLNAIARLLLLIGVFGLLSLALNLHWGYTGLFNIGIVGFMAIGIYVTAILSKGAALTEPPAGSVGGFGLPLWLGIVGGVLAAALFGALVALPALRLRADYFAIVTVGVGEIVRFTVKERAFEIAEIGGYHVGLGSGSGLVLDFSIVDGLVTTVGALGGLSDQESLEAWSDLTESTGLQPTPEPVFDAFVYALVVVAFLVLAYSVVRRTGNSPFGRVLKAIREDEEATQSLGKNTARFKIKAFMLGCGLMGLGGILFYTQIGAVSPAAFRPRFTFFIWIALIIGGAGSNTGSIIGGALFAAFLFEGPRYLKNLIEATIDPTAVSSFGRTIPPLVSAADPVPFFAYAIANVRELQLLIMGAILIYLMHNRPEGALGHRKEPASSISLARPDGDRTGSPTVTADGGTTQEGEADE